MGGKSSKQKMAEKGIRLERSELSSDMTTKSSFLSADTFCEGNRPRSEVGGDFECGTGDDMGTYSSEEVKKKSPKSEDATNTK